MTDSEGYQQTSSGSSIFLIIMFVIGTLSSLIVTLDLLLRGNLRTASSALVFILSLSSTISTIGKAPFVYDTTLQCKAILYLFYYTYFQSLIVTVFMLQNNNISLLTIRDTMSNCLSRYQIDKKTLAFIILFPMIPPLLPLLTNGFKNKYEWCVVNTKSDIGPLNQIFIHGLIWVITLISLLQIGQLYYRTRHISDEIYELMKKEILTGSGIYAIVTVIHNIVTDSLVLAMSSQHEHLNERQNYYGLYCRLLLHYLLPMCYAVIYIIEKEYLQVM
jgi:hypothetical protein